MSARINLWARRGAAALLCLVLLLGVAPAVSAAGTVRVTLPDFPVTFNGTVIDNEYSDYPLIVYNYITYFPMTWYGASFLGLESSWSAAEGLEVTVNPNGLRQYYAYPRAARNPSAGTASVAAFRIRVNGKEIDNAAEEYPLLQFRNVTYFPLTWRFAVDEFGWSYNWDETAGLRINSMRADAPLYAGYRWMVTLNWQDIDQGGYKNWSLVRIPEGGSEAETVYTWSGIVSSGNLLLRDDGLFLDYRSGTTATMSGETRARLGAEGVCSLTGLYGPEPQNRNGIPKEAVWRDGVYYWTDADGTQHSQPEGRAPDGSAPSPAPSPVTATDLSPVTATDLG